MDAAIVTLDDVPEPTGGRDCQKAFTLEVLVAWCTYNLNLHQFIAPYPGHATRVRY